ncbi:MAG: protein kinase [Planctomycetes bacterium]|nr:protein kinase [Planctomycetota bacterium]
MTDPSEELDPLERLMEEFTRAVRAGKAVDVEDWAQRHPEQADVIRELFPAILAVEGMKSGSDAARTPRPAFNFVDRLGDYRIVAEVGRGGMGVVYEAEQESLGRRVAVKVLPPMRDERRVQRFEREARTAARLHHTNIVPIFGVGEHEGWHYYVMPLIRGVGLDAVLGALRGTRHEPHPSAVRRIAELTPQEAAKGLQTGRFRPITRGSGSGDALASASGPDSEAAAVIDAEAHGSGELRPASATPRLPASDEPGADATVYWHSVAEIARQVAAALGYAHAQGVLHRDVKPGNLLLDAHGVVWVTDFGLAKAIGTDELTMSGDLVGTLQYMAPEQLHGRYDARTDVYGLGLVLYELLTLQPAFSDPERGSLLKKVEQGRPTRPSLLRPGIPRDLETIVLLALQPDPTHRYQTAADLADDLQRFLEDRPVRARRANAVEHAWRWCRRNRLVASLAAVAMISLLAALVTGWSGYVSTRDTLAVAKVARDDATRNFALAKKVLENLFDTAAGPDEFELVVDEASGEASLEWVQPTQPSPETAAMLETLLRFYDEFAAQNADATDMRLEIAHAHRRAGELYARLLRTAEADKAFARSLELFRELDAGSRTHATTIAAIHNRMGRVALDANDAERARSAAAAAIAAIDTLSSRPARFERARAHELVAGTIRKAPLDERELRAQQPDRGARRGPPGSEPREGREPARRNPQDGPRADRPPREELPEPIDSSDRNRLLVELRTAWELDQQLTQEAPENPAYQAAAARTTRYYAWALERSALPQERLERRRVLEAEIRRLEALATHDAKPINQLRLAQSYLALLPTPLPLLRGLAQAAESKLVERLDAKLIERVDQAVAIAERLLAREPDEAEYRWLFGVAVTERSRIDLEAGRTPDLDRLRKAVEILAETRIESRIDVQRRLAAGATLVRALQASGDTDATAQELQRTFGFLEALPARGTRRGAPGRSGVEPLGSGRPLDPMDREHVEGEFRRRFEELGIDVSSPEVGRAMRRFLDARERQRPPR